MQDIILGTLLDIKQWFPTSSEPFSALQIFLPLQKKKTEEAQNTDRRMWGFSQRGLRWAECYI